MINDNGREETDKSQKRVEDPDKKAKVKNPPKDTSEKKGKGETHPTGPK